jgi:hypothetical protein
MSVSLAREDWRVLKDEASAHGMLSASTMSLEWSRLVDEEDGSRALGYLLVTGVLSILVFQPEFAAAFVYRLGDL